jgi:hypothetical protein
MKRSRKGLRRRYGSLNRARRGHSWLSESAITLPAGGGLVDVVLVDGKGGIVKKLARSVSRSEASKIILRRHA